jgi:hypothetical protein
MRRQVEYVSFFTIGHERRSGKARKHAYHGGVRRPGSEKGEGGLKQCRRQRLHALLSSRRNKYRLRSLAGFAGNSNNTGLLRKSLSRYRFCFNSQLLK